MTLPTEPLHGLPPVAPPSGRFIAQLFLVPGLIVVGAVSVLWGFTWLVGASRTPEQFLKDLGNPNTEVRWRAASDLAQVLKKDQALASNPRFALDLADLLSQTIRDSKRAENTEKRVSPREGSFRDDQKASEGEATYIQFLINCLGSCNLPVGVPLLGAIAEGEEGTDAKTALLRRQVAVWGLANIGERVKHLDTLSAAQQSALIDALDVEAHGATTERSQWAQQTRDYLKARFSGNAQAMNVDVVLARCARAQDPVLRKLVAFALNIWLADPEANDHMEETLLALSYDDGHGAESPDQRARGLEVRYKAVEGLARRGSPKIAKRLGVLVEMLDEEQLAKSFQSPANDGQVIPDQTAVYSTLTSSLRAVAELHRRRPELDLSKLEPAIERLTHSQNAAVRAEAERTQITLRK